MQHVLHRGISNLVKGKNYIYLTIHQPYKEYPTSFVDNVIINFSALNRQFIVILISHEEPLQARNKNMEVQLNANCAIVILVV